MAGMIGVSPWLHDLYLRGGAYADPCRRIMRAQIVIERRRQHILNLDTEYVRRAIAHGARSGQVARVVVDCVRCRWQAWLGDWVRSADMPPQEIAAILATVRTERDVLRWCFLRRCGGMEIASEMLASERAPADLEG